MERLNGNGLKQSLRELLRATVRHDLSGLSAQLAFRFMHATLWVLVFAAAASGFLSRLIGGPHPADRLMQTVFAGLPDDIRAVLAPQLHRLMDTHRFGLLALGALSALATGAVAFLALMKALNQVHETRDDRALRERVLLALGLAISLGVGVLVALTLLLLQLLAGPAIAENLGIGGSVAWLLRIAAILLVVLVLVAGSAVLYRVTPREDSPAKWVTVGAVLFVTVWLTATLLLALYLSRFGAYANAYGVLGALIVVFSWYYATSFALLLGAEVNVLVETRATAMREGRMPLSREAQFPDIRGKEPAERT
jgi:membrane protein